MFFHKLSKYGDQVVAENTNIVTIRSVAMQSKTDIKYVRTMFNAHYRTIPCYLYTHGYMLIKRKPRINIFSTTLDVTQVCALIIFVYLSKCHHITEKRGPTLAVWLSG